MSFDAALEQVKSFPKQFVQGIEVAKEIIVEKPLQGVGFCGMGGSALAAEIIKAYLEEINFPLPVFIFRSYELPNFVNKNYLIFCISYSGNTEETISMFKDGIRKKAQIVTMSTSGILKELAKKHQVPWIELPKGFQPRLGIGFMLFSCLKVLENSGFTIDLENELGLLEFVSWEKNIEKAKKLVERINKVPIIYATKRFLPVAKIWKALINECSKMHCFVNEISEINHNEMVGFVKSKDFFVIILQDYGDHYRMKRRMSLLQELLNEEKIKNIMLAITGASFLVRALSTVHLGMHLALELAKRNNVDPEKVDMIEKFKKKLGKFI